MTPQEDRLLKECLRFLEVRDVWREYWRLARLRDELLEERALLLVEGVDTRAFDPPLKVKVPDIHVPEAQFLLTEAIEALRKSREGEARKGEVLARSERPSTENDGAK